MTTKEKCVVAIIGAGYTAREHIRAFQDISSVKIAGITSRTRARAEALAAEFNIPVVCNSVDELYTKTKANLVVATVPELAANSVSRACFEYPWTVLMEKPAGYNLADAEDIESAARAKNSRVYVALNRQFYSSTQTVTSDLKNSNEPRYIKVQDQEDQTQALASGQPALVVQNWMYANSIHIIDYFRFLGRGKIVNVKPVVAWNPSKPGVVVSRIDYDSGDIGLYEGIWNAPGPWAVSVTSSSRRWELRPLEQASYQNRGERKLQTIEPHVWDQTFKPGFRMQAEHAVYAALGKPSLSTSIEDAYETMKLVRDIFQQ